jgi:hypothetical protein
MAVAAWMTGLHLRHAVVLKLKHAHSARPSKLTTHLETCNNLGKKYTIKEKMARQGAHKVLV